VCVCAGLGGSVVVCVCGWVRGYALSPGE